MFRGGIPFSFWINLWYQQFNVIFLNFKGFFQRSICSVETTCQPFGKIQPERLETRNLLEALNQGKFVGPPKMDPTIWILHVVALISITVYLQDPNYIYNFTGCGIESRKKYFSNYIYNAEVALILMHSLAASSQDSRGNTRITSVWNLCCFWKNPCQRNNLFICTVLLEKGHTGTSLSSKFLGWTTLAKNKAQIQKQQKNNRRLESRYLYTSILRLHHLSHLCDDFWLFCLALHFKVGALRITAEVYTFDSTENHLPFLDACHERGSFV